MAEVIASKSVGRVKHVVDVLIEERAPNLAAHWSWPVVRPLLNGVLGYDRAVAMANAIAPLPGDAALAYISDLLKLKLDVQGLENVPASGRCVVVSNHPTGIADGMAMFDVLRPLRPDVCFFANADAHRVCPGFHQTLIPVEWVYEKRTPAKTRDTLRAAVQALKDERPLVLFPAGRLARKRDGKLIDPEWSNTCASLSRKHDAPIVPVHMSGPWSFWFHLFDGVSGELRDITLFHEFLNKAGRTFSLIVGPTIPAEAMEGDATLRARDLKFYIETVLVHGPQTKFAV
ncbi:MAG: 1-acyl-sn-glycerol-3-phosphate acyltransferase [Caulobacterales bacterium]